MRCEAFRGLIRGDEREIEAAWRFCQDLPDSLLEESVALRVEDPLRFALVFWRILDRGGCPVLMPTPEESEELRLGAVVDDEGGRRLSQQRPAWPGGGYYAFSSGSQGRRRPLRFELERALANAAAHARSLGLESGHTLAQTLRLHHPFGVVAYLLTPLAARVPVRPGVFFDSLGDQDLGDWVVHLTPYHLQSLRRGRGHRPRRLGKLTVGAAPLARAEALDALQWCDQVYTTYGLSEAGPRVTTGRVSADTFGDGWIGHLLEGIEARTGEDECLWLRTPYHAEGHGGFFSTGDRVEFRPDGSLVFRSRLYDVLRIRGKTYPRPDYNARVERLLGVASEVCQLPYSDALVVFLEGQPQAGAERKLLRHLPELRGARLQWLAHFERTVLGKTDLRKMLQECGP